jgi:hypothetical protein
MASLAQETPLPNEAEQTAAFIAFLKAASLKRHPTGQMRRFNQGRASGAVEAEFTVPDTLPAEHRVGLFARPGTYRAFIRFANASSKTDREPDVRGMAIRVDGVEGANLTPGKTFQDFVLNSHPVMPAPDAARFFELLQALEAGGFRAARYFLTHPQAALLGLAARGRPSSHLDIPYWSTVPSLFGEGRAVKYIAQPCSSRTSQKPDTPGETYLRDAMRAHLSEADACFDFLIQFQTDPGHMPIEDATVEWKRGDSDYLPVARIRIPRQSIDDPALIARGEAMGFSPWHALVEHKPLGSMNRARRAIYVAMAQFRREHEGR